MGLRIADGTQNLNLSSILNITFSSSSGIAKHDLRCMQFTVAACKVNKRVTDYLWQQLQKLFEPFQQINKG
jgi:hypothetical protein